MNSSSSAPAKPLARASSEPVPPAAPSLEAVSEPSSAAFAELQASSQASSQALSQASDPHSATLSEVLDEDARAVVVAIPASPEFVRVVRLAVAGVATRMRFSYEQVEDIKLAVSEACNNAILHAQPPGGGAPTQVVVRLRPLGDRLEITVFDQGHLPLDGLEIPVSRARGAAKSAAKEQASDGAGGWRGLSDLDDLPEGGMGLMLIQSLMDEVSSHTGAPDHTALHMVKLTRPS